jgi:hypothetical protein
MNTNDYVYFGHLLVDGTIALIALAGVSGLAWAIHAAIKDPHDFFGC